MISLAQTVDSGFIKGIQDSNFLNEFIKSIQPLVSLGDGLICYLVKKRLQGKCVGLLTIMFGIQYLPLVFSISCIEWEFIMKHATLARNMCGNRWILCQESGQSKRRFGSAAIAYNA